ncbi:MAG: tetratricopeptide repeat protein [Prevotella sp.]
MSAALLWGRDVVAQTPQQWRDSLATLNKEISQTPYSSDLYLRKAAVNIELHQWEYALETYSDILRREPANPAALYYRAFVNGKLRRYDLSLNDYQQLLNLSPSHLEARLGLAYTLIKMGKRQEALDQYSLCVEQHRDSAVAYASRACLEEELKYYDTALYDWDKAISLAPANNDYLFSKANLLVKMERKEDARKCLGELLRRGVARTDLEELLRLCR